MMMPTNDTRRVNQFFPVLGDYPEAQFIYDGIDMPWCPLHFLSPYLVLINLTF